MWILWMVRFTSNKMLYSCYPSDIFNKMLAMLKSIGILDLSSFPWLICLSPSTSADIVVGFPSPFNYRVLWRDIDKGLCHRQSLRSLEISDLQVNSIDVQTLNVIIKSLQCNEVYTFKYRSVQALSVIVL